MALWSTHDILSTTLRAFRKSILPIKIKVEEKLTLIDLLLEILKTFVLKTRKIFIYSGIKEKENTEGKQYK